MDHGAWPCSMPAMADEVRAAAKACARDARRGAGAIAAGHGPKLPGRGRMSAKERLILQFLICRDRVSIGPRTPHAVKFAHRTEDLKTS
jgi:hypothetical protein